jgi:hypothetical protein
VRDVCITLITLVPVLSPNYKQHILSLAEVTEVCYSLAEIYVKSVHLNFSDGGCVLMIWGGAQAIKGREPLVCVLALAFIECSHL